MSINFQKAFGTYEAALKLRSQRAEVLSANLANADTPNFKARDFDFHQALKTQLDNTGGLRANHSGHLNSQGQATGGMNLQYRVPTQPSIDGNTVDEHAEHGEFMQNSLEFQVAFTLLNSRLKGMMNVIKGD